MLTFENLFLSNDFICDGDFRFKLSKDGVTLFDPLSSNQEEADTKLVLSYLRVLSSSLSNVCTCSSSADTDIVVIALELIEEKNRVFFDHGKSSNREKVCLKEIPLQS